MTPRQSKTIRDLLGNLPEKTFLFKGDPEQVISNVTWDYQQVKPGSMYFCVENEEFQEDHIQPHSLEYWQSAVQSGAICLVTNPNRISNLPEGVSLIEVEHLNASMALLTQAFFDFPLANINVIGITGTNGKTTTSQMIDSIFHTVDAKTGIIGTIGVFYPSGKQKASHLSNPMATELFAIGEQMRQESVEYLTMEVTSHAMAFERNFAVDFNVAIFTNLTQDHLDYHRTIDRYKKAKLKFFQQIGSKKKKAYGIVNIDDAIGQEFIEAIGKQLRSSGKAEVLTYGIRNKDADLVAYPREMTGGYSVFDVLLRGNHLGQVNLPMPGLFNIYNALAAFGGALAMEISIEKIMEGLNNAGRVDGRFEKIECDADFDVYVDYAHTPDSLEKILTEVTGLTKKRTIVVFGCGGDRDRSKRSKMGSIGAEMADICVITSDNPRTEDPNRIIDDILSGIPDDSMARVIVEPDRKQAIITALEMAAVDDSVVVAGKGHETYQIIGQTVHPFSDRDVIEFYFSPANEKSRRAWVEIDLAKLKRNFQLIQKDKSPELKTLVVVKADALGHGIIEVAREALAVGCEYLGVATVSEAMILRNAFTEALILIFGERSNSELSACARYGFTIQIQTKETAEKFARIARELRVTASVHLKVDTGMGRWGVHWERAADLYTQISDIADLNVTGIMTHFAQSDEKDKTYANLQWDRFQSVMDTLIERGIDLPPRHACNTGGYLDLPQAHGDMVRLGTLPLGVYPSKVCRRIEIDNEPLTPVMGAKTVIAFTKTLNPGESTGYGMHFTADKPTRVAVLPVGYGDGYPRLRNTGHVLIHGMEARIVGGNAMDAMMVDISEIPEAMVGDEVVLLGPQGEREITAMMLADWAKTVTYDILSRWTARMDRVYK